MIALALEALAASTVLMLLVLVLRGPVRRVFGAELAYLLWLLPIVRLLLPPLPSGWNPYGAAPMAGVGEQAMVMIAPNAPVDTVAAVPVGAATGAATWLPLVWMAGALAILLVQLLRYCRFRAQVMRGAHALTRVGSVKVVESAGATGPLAFGLLHRVVAFPRDFAASYDAQERELALAHEIGHHRRGDLWANWIALALLALHWFNPVAWIAFRAFRADQEMANDAGVLARAGTGLRHAYGCAIVKAAHGRALTPVCHLNTVNDLKGRLRMLARERVSGKRAATGGTVIALFAGAGLVSTASGMPAAARMRAGVERVTGVRLAALDRDMVAALTPVARTRTSGKVTIIEQGRAIVLRDHEAAAYIAAHPAPTPPVPPMPPVPSASGGAEQAPSPPLPPTPPTATSYSIRDMAGERCDNASAIVGRSHDRRQVVICSGEDSADVREARREAMQEAREAQREAMREAMNAHREAVLEARDAAREARSEAIAADREARTEAMRARRDAMNAGREARRSVLATLASTRTSLAIAGHLTGKERAEAQGEIDAAATRRDD